MLCVSKFLTFPVCPPKGEGLTMLESLNNFTSSLLPPVFTRLGSICLLYGFLVCMCTHTSACMYQHAIRRLSVCLVGPQTLTDGFQSDKTHSKAHICSIEEHMQSSMQLSKVAQTQSIFTFQVISTVRRSPFQRLMAGRVKSSLASAAQCAVCFC